MDQPSEKNLIKMRNFVEKFAAKSGSYLHPDRTVTDVVVEGLARHIEEVASRSVRVIFIRTSRLRLNCAVGSAPVTRCRLTSTVIDCCS